MKQNRQFEIGIWGQYGDGGKIADGQAVRTTIITKELQNKYGKDSIALLNTNAWKKNPWKFFWKSFSLVKNSKVVIVAPADNGYKVFVPLLLIFNLFFHRTLIHIVIGGFLPALLKKNPIYLFFEKKFSAIYVQTTNLKNDLTKLGVNNIGILSNLKRLNTKQISEVIRNDDKEIRICLFSRLNQEKGVEDAIEAIRIVNNSLGAKVAKLDLYGLIQCGYEKQLEELIDKNRDIVEYKGIVDYDKTVETLSGYFALLFPTYYYGEGFPGNVVDAYNSGLPIIATDWLYNKDVIIDGRNGILVPIKSPKKLAQAVLSLYNNREKHLEIVKNNINDSRLYHPDIVLKEFYTFLDKKLERE